LNCLLQKPVVQHQWDRFDVDAAAADDDDNNNNNNNNNKLP
jgi:hypothetical protein